MLLLADAFAQEVVGPVATLWTFSMRTVDAGALLLSARLEVFLQRRHCRVKDWPYSQVALAAVCYFVWLTFNVALLSVFVVLGRVGKRRALSSHLHAAAC
jgi:hypothetical protein